MPLSQYVISDLWGTFEIAFSCVLFTYNIPKKNHYRRNLILIGLAMAFIVVVYALYDYWAETPYLNVAEIQFSVVIRHIIRQVLIFMLCFVLMIGILDASFWSSMLCVSSAAATQVLISSLYILIMRVLNIPNGFLVINNQVVIGWLIFILGQGTGICLISMLFVRNRIDYKLESSYISMMFFTTITVVCIFNIFVADSGEQSGILYICYRMLGATFALMVLVLHNQLLCRNAAQTELGTLEQMLVIQGEQHLQAMRNTELINAKCHDLRHQIRHINSDAIDVEELAKIVRIYDNTIKTGNTELDIILTEKSLQCEASHVDLLCSIEGTRLSFLTAPDLYALFGNIIENAIEYLDTVPNHNLRFLHITSRTQAGMFIITAENYFSGELEFDESGLPVTTKADQNYHGFGTKSIRLIAEKYGGTANIKTKNNTFIVLLMFPLQ